jgi:RHS repeat-associated protein
MPPNVAPPSGRPANPIAPPVFAVTGNARADSVLATLDVTIAPFRQAPPPEQGAAGYVAQGLGGVLGVINAPMMFIDAAASQGIAAILDATGLSALFPALPVATIGLSMHLGTPHTHVHPPSLVPPAPPIPLPSLGIAFLAGSASVLVGGVPALRAGDIGLGITCGSLAPPFEIMTGASGVYFAGARVARFGMDITFHCNPVSPMGAFAIGMGVAGVVAGAAGAAAQAAAGNSGAAIAQGIQAGLDAAAMAVSALRGKDPAGPPGVGVLLGPPMGNVMAGGPPIPNLGALAQGKIYSALGRALRSMRGAMRRRTPAPDANGRACDGGEPVHVVTGANFNTHVDFASSLGAFTWARYTSSADHATRGVLGFGWRHAFESRLSIQLHRVTFEGWQGEHIVFPRMRGTAEVAMHGYRLRRLENHRYTVTHPRLGTLMFQQDGPGSGVARLVAVRNAKHDIELRYDTHRRLVEIMERVAGAAATYALRYDDAGQLAEVWGSRYGEPSTRLVRYRHDLAGDLLGAEDVAGKSDAYAYDRTHRIVSATDRIGYSFTWKYDMQGRCIETQGKDGLWYAAFEYLPDKQTTKMTIHDGSVYTFVYDEDGVITKVIGPCGDEKKRLRALDGTVLAEIDAGGQRVDFVYDAHGALVARRGRFGHLFPPSLVASGIPQMLGRRLPKDTRGFYFGGALARTTPPLPPPEQRRDHLGKVIHERDAQGHEQRWQYDAIGNEVAHVDRDGRLHRREIVRWGLVGARIDPVGNKVRYEYNPHQRITRVVDGGGGESKYVYDSHDRVIEVHRTGALRERYVWDGHRLVEKQDADGNALLRITPHANGLAGRIERADGSTLVLDYDRNGKVTRADSSAHRVRREHTVFEEVALEDCDGRTVRHEYGWHGEITTRIADKFVATRHRHGATIVLDDPTGRRRVIEPATDGSVSIDHGNGTHEVQQFDAAGRIVGRTCARPDDRVGRGLRWNVRHQYTPDGDLIATSDSIRGTVRYGLDEAHRLVRTQQDGGAPVTYRHDAANNLVELPAVGVVELAPGNRVRTAATEQFHYDARGRLARRVGANGAESRYHYDAEDQLVRVDDGGEAWTATYDALGRRVTFGRGDRRTRLWWDGDRIAARESPDGGFRIYLYVDRESLIPIGIVDWDSIDAPAESGRSYAVFCDQVGLPQHIEDERGDIVWWADRATPYGEVFVQPGNTFEYNLRFPGHLYDPDLRLHYNRFRDYDPALGRYLQPDPMGVRGGVNLYAYPSNPLVAVDVLGLTNHDNQENGPPRSEEGEGRPADENPNPTADAPPPKLSRDEAVARAEAAAHAERKRVNAELAAGRMPEFGGQKDGPACVAAVVDRVTGDTFVAHNEPTGGPPKNLDDFHPVLRDRIAAQQHPTDGATGHPSEPATHAEVLALNDALLARDPGPNHTLTDADLGDFVQLPMWSREPQTKPHMPPGGRAPCCGNCAPITNGTDNLSGSPAPAWVWRDGGWRPPPKP